MPEAFGLYIRDLALSQHLYQRYRRRGARDIHCEGFPIRWPTSDLLFPRPNRGVQVCTLGARTQVLVCSTEFFSRIHNGFNAQPTQLTRNHE